MVRNEGSESFGRIGAVVAGCFCAVCPVEHSETGSFDSASPSEMKFVCLPVVFSGSATARKFRGRKPQALSVLSSMTCEVSVICVDFSIYQPIALQEPACCT